MYSFNSPGNVGSNTKVYKNLSSPLVHSDPQRNGQEHLLHQIIRRLLVRGSAQVQDKREVVALRLNCTNVRQCVVLQAASSQ